MEKIKFHILKDMDGVEACWDDAMRTEFETYLPKLTFLSAKERKHWEITENYEEKYADIIRSFWCKPGFFLGLKPMPGSIQATEWMIEQGYNVTFCTTPLYTNDPRVVNRCNDEKREYLYETYKHLVRPNWFFHPKSPIQFNDAYDKTIIHGHVLIDDKPIITGRIRPSWKHLIFSENYPFSMESIATKINWNLEDKHSYQGVLLREYEQLLNGHFIDL